MYACEGMCVHTEVRGQFARGGFLPFSIWLSGIKLRTSGLEVVTLPSETSLGPHSICFNV